MSAVYDSYMKKITNRNKQRKRTSSRHVQKYISVEKKLISRDKFYRIFTEFNYPSKFREDHKFLSKDDLFRHKLNNKKQDRSFIKEHLNDIFTNPDHPFHNLILQFVNLFHASYALSPEMLMQKSYDSANLSADKNFNHKIKRLLRCAIHDIKNFVMETKLLLKKIFPGMNTKAHNIICQIELHQHLFPLLVPSLLDLYLLSNRQQNVKFRLACVELSKSHNLGTLGVSEELRLTPPDQEEPNKGSLSKKFSLGSKYLEVVPEMETASRLTDTLGSSRKMVESNLNLNVHNSPSTSSPERGEVIAKQDFALMSHKDCCGPIVRRTTLPVGSLGRPLSTLIDIPLSMPIRQDQVFLAMQPLDRARAKSQAIHSPSSPLQRGWSNPVMRLSHIASVSSSILTVDGTTKKKVTFPKWKRKPRQTKSLGYKKDESLNSLNIDLLGSLTDGFQGNGARFQESKLSHLHQSNKGNSSCFQESKSSDLPSSIFRGESDELTKDDNVVQFEKEAVPDRRRIKTTSLLSASLKRTPEVPRPRTPTSPKKVPYQEAIDCIKSIVNYETPEEKIRVLSKAIDLCCKAIDEFYEKYPVDNAKQKRICPDDLLSIFSYLLIHTHCNTFISQLQFVDDFVAENFRCDVMGYYLATAKAATNIVIKNYQQVEKFRKCKSL